MTTADLSAADIHGSIHGDAGDVAAHSCVTAPIELDGRTGRGRVVLPTFTGGNAAPEGLTFQILKIMPNEGKMFRTHENCASSAFDNVGIRVLAIH